MTVDEIYRSLETSDAADEAVSVIMKLRGETCNIDCLYCYEKRKESPNARSLAPEDAAKVAQIFAGRTVTVGLHGGEPLTVGRPRMAAILDALAAQPNVEHVSMQTNGVLLDDDWLDLFDEHWPGLDFGISLDGDPLGNSWRVDYQGNPTYESTVRAIQLLGDRGRTTGIITVVTPHILGRATEVLDHICSFPAVNSISFIPCFDMHVDRPTAMRGRRIPISRLLQQQSVGGDDGPLWTVKPADYADFILDLSAHWVSSGLFRRVKLEPAVAAIRSLRGLHTEDCHFTCMKCDHIFTLYPDGRFGSCDELAWPDAQLVTIGRVHHEEDIVALQKQSDLLTAGRELMTKCLTCSHQESCGGGCVATRLRFLRVAGSDDAYCQHRKQLVDGVGAILAAPEDPSSRRCRRVHWRTLDPNTMYDVVGFLEEWDGAFEPADMLPPSAEDLWESRRSACSNPKAILNPKDPGWRDAIEDRVWPIIDVLTRTWGCVTYDSCEGHPAPHGAEGEGALQVGILPRSTTESARLARLLCRAVRATEGRLPPEIRAVAIRGYLTCGKTGEKHSALGLHVEASAGVPWNDYIVALPGAVAVISAALERAGNEAVPDTCECSVQSA